MGNVLDFCSYCCYTGILKVQILALLMGFWWTDTGISEVRVLALLMGIGWTDRALATTIQSWAQMFLISFGCLLSVDLKVHFIGLEHISGSLDIEKVFMLFNPKHSLCHDTKVWICSSCLTDTNMLLEDKCYCYIGDSGMVETWVKSLQKLGEDLRWGNQPTSSPLLWWQSSRFAWLNPIMGPVIFF